MANDPRFEVYPRRAATPEPKGPLDPKARSAEFGWRFRAANGQITAVGGEGFTRREDAHRAVEDFVSTVSEFFGEPPQSPPPILDVDE